MKIRQARISDAEQIAGIQVTAWRSAYRGIIADDHLDQLDEGQRADQWRKTIGDIEAQVSVLVAEEPDDTLTGFAAWRSGADATAACELLALYVFPESQRGGRGRALVEALAVGLESNGGEWIAWVLEANVARAFYESLGAVLCGRGEFETGGKCYPTVCYRWTDACFEAPGQ